MLTKYKYAGAIGTTWTTICDIWTGPKGKNWSRMFLPAGAKFMVSGLSMDTDGRYMITVRQHGGVTHSVSADLFDRNFIAV